jgi:hypothetical protein
MEPPSCARSGPARLTAVSSSRSMSRPTPTETTRRDAADGNYGRSMSLFVMGPDRPIDDLVGSVWARMPRNNPAGSGINWQMNYAKCVYRGTIRQHAAVADMDRHMIHRTFNPQVRGECRASSPSA